MSKAKAFWYTILWALLAVILLLFHIAIWPGAFLLLAGISGIIWCCKHLRDARIVRDANAQLERSAEQKTAPPMASKGSRRLFVPPPIDRR
jgi:hypothetical protein